MFYGSVFRQLLTLFLKGSTTTTLGVEDPGQHPAEAVSPGQGGQGEGKGTQKDPSRRLEDEWPLQSIRMLEALLAICLHSANSGLQRIEPELSFQVPRPSTIPGTKVTTFDEGHIKGIRFYRALVESSALSRE